MAAGVSNLPIGVAIDNSGNPNNGGSATFLGSALSITSTDSGLWNSGKTNTGGYFVYAPVPTGDNFTAVVHVTNIAPSSVSAVRAGIVAISAQNNGTGTFGTGATGFESVASWQTVNQQTLGERYDQGDSVSGDATRTQEGTGSGPNWLGLIYSSGLTVVMPDCKPRKTRA